MHLAFVLATAATLAPPVQSPAQEEAPVTNKTPHDPRGPGPALGLPDWLRISGSVRARYEAIDGQFRANPMRSNRDDYLVIRSLLKVEADFLGRFTATVEAIDARQEGASQGSQINTGIVNTLDFLQANLNADLGQLGGGRHVFTAGRFTMDQGSRRLVARNRFRNTINAFDGVAWDWESEEGSKLDLFYTLPASRLPSGRSALLDNEQEFDDQSRDNAFFGGHFETPLSARTQLELYTYGIDDQVGTSREHLTPGARIKNRPARESLDYEVESAIQFGTSELPDLQPDTDLDHLAWFGHASIGYTFEGAWKPRMRLAWDYASGDDDPGDDESNRFDTLFGARRFEFGPTGIFGAVARSNLNSPEIRLTLKPSERVSFMTAFREVWLADARDAWVPAGVRDPTGDSGTHVGEQIEARLRYDSAARGLRFEIGGAYLFAGRFQEQAPNGRDQDTAYGYVQVNWTL